MKISIDKQVRKKWDKAIATFDPKKFNDRAKKELKKATTKNANLLKNEITRMIRAKRYDKNAALTIGIKHSRTPLIDFGELVNSISVVNVEAMSVFVGVLRTDRMFKIAKIVHDGTAIPVTKKMRGLFTLLALVSEKRIDAKVLKGRARILYDRAGPKFKWKRLKQDTDYIVIPERPFIDKAFRKVFLRKKIYYNWIRAYEKALRYQARSVK